MRSHRVSFPVLAWAILAASALPQTQTGQIPRVGGVNVATWADQSANPYAAKPVTPVPLENSGRIESLFRAGNLYLSLPDAIALALENNLDVELQRYSPGIAESDILRAKGGGQTRGVPLSSVQPPTGVGGPASPLLNSGTPGFTVSTSVAANPTSLAFITQPQTNLQITTGAFSPGPALPVFDPTLIGQWGWNHQSTPQTNPFVTGANVLVNSISSGTGSIVQGFSPGTQIGAAFTGAGQSNNSIRSTLNPYNNSTFGLTLTQPLLRGFGIAVNRRYIRIANNGRKLTDLVFRQQLIDTVSGIIRLYYDLVSLNEDVRVKQQTLGLAETLYENNRQQVDQGTMAPIELVHAQALIAAGRQDLANSDGLEREQELVLKYILTRRGTADPRIRDVRIIPTDPIPAPGGQEPVRPIQDLLDAAFRNRPDLASAAIQVTNSQIFLEGSRNALRPEIDLIASASNTGLAGSVNSLAPQGTVVNPAFLGGFGSTLSQILQRNYPTYGVGLQLTLPLRNRVAQADYVRDMLQLRQTEIQRQKLDNQVRLEVEDALIALQRSRAAYDAAVESVRYQQQSLAAEQERFAVGLSTTFLVIQYQSMLAQARSTEVVARGAYAKAKVNLQRATGTIVEDNNISVGEAMIGRISTPPTPIPAVPPLPPTPGPEFQQPPR